MKRIWAKCTIPGLLIVLNLPIWARASEFYYDSKGRRDPFQPLGVDSGPVTSTEFRVEGIIYDPVRGSLAVINGKVLKEGDRFGAYKVDKIDRAKVTLTKDGETVPLRLTAKPKDSSYGLEEERDFGRG
jgi:hypothetical protein